jgi:Uma2 family endonuclease
MSRLEVSMKVVIPSAPPSILEERKRTGAHRWDEMWEGVWHLMPSPDCEHQDLERDLLIYLQIRWAKPRRAQVHHQINLAPPGGWPENFRIPDLVLVSARRFAINRKAYFEGAPDVAVEIHSPGDETYEKLPFYAELGAPEVWIIHRDTKVPEIYLLRKGRYRKQKPTASGWVKSPATGVELRVGKPGKLAVRMNGEDATRQDLPVD